VAAPAAPPPPAPSAPEVERRAQGRGGREEQQQQQQDPDQAAADRAADERERIEEKLDLAGAGEDTTRRQLDALQIARIQEELHRTHARLRRVQRENDRLRANDWQGRQQARQEAEQKAQQTIDRQQGEIESLKEEKRALEQEKQMHELEQRFEEKYGRADTSVGKELLGMLKEHGPDLLPQLADQIMAHLKKNAAGKGGPAAAATGADALPDAEALKAALENAPDDGAAAGPQHDRPQQQPPRENPHPEDMPPQATPPPSAPRQPEQQRQQQEEEPPAAQPSPADVFVQAVTERALVTLDEDLGAEEFAGEIRAVLDGLEDSAGFAPTADTFVALTEQLIPPVAERAASPQRVAGLLAPFTADLPPMALRIIRSTPPQALKATMIDPQGLDYQGHEDYLLRVLEALHAQL
jgi:hypothetical protein